MNVTIPKQNAEHSLAPAWSPVKNTQGRVCRPYITCKCGRNTGIGLHHIHADGRVTASVYHKKGNTFPEDPNGCEWHVFLTLADYDQGEFKPNQQYADETM